MITKVILKHFKRFETETFELSESIILAGPNNAGKSTLLQAIATWRMGLDRWMAQRKTSKAAKRTGVPITRQEFAAVPLREMNLLWEGRKVSGGGQKNAGVSRFIEITLEGRTQTDSWECGLEFQYANPEMIYVRPLGAKQADVEELHKFPPNQAVNLDLVYVPPLSGIERDEPRRDRGIQELLIGQGRPGEILRNLLLEISEKTPEDWNILATHMENLFSVELLKPKYTIAQPYIICEYKDQDHSRSLDLSNAGSGLLQVLLLFAFIYARRADVLLLDEPDAHQHVILQMEVYDVLRRVASQHRSQILVATHSQVILDATDPNRILNFIGPHPRLLLSHTERDQLREALKRLTTSDLLLAKKNEAVLYVEGDSDVKILLEWAKILNHPGYEKLANSYVNRIGGRNLRDAKAHFFALRSAIPDLSGMCLLDGDNRDEPDDEMSKANLRVLRWRRYEIENYLLIPSALVRFVGSLFEDRVNEEFNKQVPVGTDLFSDHVSLERIKASDEFLVPLLGMCGRPTTKKDLYLLASQMKVEEIHPEVIEKLDSINEQLS